MDFSLTEEQEAIRDLARQIFEGHVSHERLLELEKSGEWYDTTLWGELARANLTSLAVPEAYGGGGFGAFELCLALEEQGRHVAPVPLLATALLGALPIAEFGSDAQKRRWLPEVAERQAVLSAALCELGGSVPSLPRVSARRDADGWRLDGEKECVPGAHLASAILVPARTDRGVGVFVLDPGAAGVALERQVVTHREPQSRLLLDGARVPEADVLGDPDAGAAIVDWIVDRACLGLAAIQVGVADGALRQTASYVSERKQFGRPIGTFQGVALRAADAYIDIEAMRAILYEAAWRLSAGREATAEIAAAKPPPPPLGQAERAGLRGREPAARAHRSQAGRRRERCGRCLRSPPSRRFATQRSAWVRSCPRSRCRSPQPRSSPVRSRLATTRTSTTIAISPCSAARRTSS
jgi:alkylation response protein AidB-like acyl-CoA dehydrogenase